LCAWDFQPVPRTPKFRQTSKAIDDSIALLEAKSYGPFLEKLVSPVDRAKKSKEDFENIVKTFPADKADFLLKALKAVKKQTPKLSDDVNTATYSLKELNEDRPFVMQKTEGKWYLRN
jgi:hypothetical protein